MTKYRGILISIFVAVLLGLLNAVHIEMERMIERDNFRLLQRSNANHNHEVILAIPKLNMATMEQMILERATPGSPNYLEWLSYDDISAQVMNENSYNVVLAWMEANNMQVTWTSRRKDYMRIVGTIAQWEALLKTEFYSFLDESLPEKEFSIRKKNQLEKDNHRIFHRAKSYSIPEEYREHITALFNTVQTPPQFHKKHHMRRPHPTYGVPYRTDLRMEAPKGIEIDGSSAPNGVVTVSFLNSYYNIPSNVALPNSTVSQSVFETGSTYFSPNDLSQFQSTYCLPQQAAVSVGGHTTEPCPTNPPTSAPDCFEGNLDIQYMMGISQQSVSIFWWVSDNGIGTSTDPFLVWILAVADDVDPPKVNSISYGIAEKGESASVMSQFNNEAMLLGLQGVTITVSSGDDGAPDENSFGICNCNVNSGSATLGWSATITQPWTGTGYFPSFPATSPYVTAVGATQGPETGSTEIACQSQQGGVITSGGGFSSFYAAPLWQQSTIAGYFSQMTSQGSMPTSGYNPHGRGYPDVSMIGVEYQVVVGGGLVSLFGTSCSSPVFAAMISLLNTQRVLQGKSTLGFLNPTLWSAGKNSTSAPLTHADISFNDITSGNNKCCASQEALLADCCNSGFVTAAGWDPVTGWGSVDFLHLANMFQVYNLTTLAGPDVYCPASSNNNNGLSTGASVAIAVVLILFILSLCGLVFCRFCAAGNGSNTGRYETEVVTATPVVFVNNPVVVNTTVAPSTTNIRPQQQQQY